MIAEFIRIERLKKGWSQEYMAFALNISQAAYSKIERGETVMSLPRLYEIAELLEMEVTELIKGGEMNMATDLSSLQKWWLHLKLSFRKRLWRAPK